MKKLLFFTFLILFSLGSEAVFAVNPDSKTKKDNPAIPEKKENKLSDEEISRLTKRLEEIRDMDKTNLTHKEMRNLKKEVKEINRNVNKEDIYVLTGGTLLLLVLLLLML